MPPKLTGRIMLQADKPVITGEDLLRVLQKVVPMHQRNRSDIDYLYKYYRGDQPILSRVKEVRPEICNKIVENRAHEIVSFKVGYVLGEPIQYVAHTQDESLGGAINQLNEFLFAEEKAAKDLELANWMHVTGTGYRLVLPDDAGREDDCPFEIYTLDPRNTFVVYENSPSKRPLLGVYYVVDEDGVVHHHCYTDTMYYEVLGLEKIAVEEPHPLGDVPIVEYPLNAERIGAFELVIGLLDAINQVDSNALDGVEQFVQALMLFKNVDISSDDYDSLRERGAIKYRDLDSTMQAEIKYLVNSLDQSQTQSLVNHLYMTVLQIVGIPTRSGGTSTYDTTGSAILLHDGFQHCETVARNFEMGFRRCEKIVIRIITRICKRLTDNVSLKPGDVEIRFTRRNYENIQEKSQVLVTMLNRNDIHPRLAFEHSGMFADPQLAYTISMEYKEEQQRKALEQAAQMREVSEDAENSDSGSDSGNRATATAWQSGGTED